MDHARAISAIQALFCSLQDRRFHEILSLLGYKSVGQDLCRTVSTVKAVLLDAESEQELPDRVQIKLQELVDAVFDADDMFDEFFISIERRKLNNAIMKKVRVFISRISAVDTFKLSKAFMEVKKTWNYNAKFKPLRKYNPEAYDVGIIGRENDLKKILDMLLHPNIQRKDVSFLAISGIGGLGKTTLAQLVFKDARVTNAFPLRLWTTVSQPSSFDIGQILAKIVASATGHNHDGSNDDIQLLQSRVRKQIAGRKYLLVLDDVWVDNLDQWRMLVGFLAGGLRGSWVVVTTRSSVMATVIGDDSAYKLGGLSKNDSWCLFKSAAFGSMQSNPPDHLVELGKKIVEGCARVPLALRVVGSLLHGQHDGIWQLFQELALSNIGESQNDIIAILKICCDYLEHPLKACFGYCALFPKNFVIEKKELISLWIAQGYIIPFEDCQTLEDAAEQCFTILLRRCFFQVAEHDEYGDIVSCRIHDLMHDIAQDVAGYDICIANSVAGKLDEKIRHISHTSSECAQFSTGKAKIRSYLNFGKWYGAPKMQQMALVNLVATCSCLRALDLSEQDIKSLPESIGKLLHLRYLDLTGNRNLKALPWSITKLFYLETLKLNMCERLEKFPPHLSRLSNLRVLEIEGCYNLISMPSNINKLIFLHTLTDFVIGGINGELEDLKALKDLKGHLVIQVKSLVSITDVKKDITMDKGARSLKSCINDENYNTEVKAQSLESGTDAKEGNTAEVAHSLQSCTYVKKDSTTGAVMRNKERLSHITIRFLCRDEEIQERGKYEEVLLEKLQPHPNIKGLALHGYHGVKVPCWATSLLNLVRLRLEDCDKLQYMPYLGNLHHLRVLRIINLINLEYIVEDGTPVSLSNSEGMPFFPSLEQVEFDHLPKLKGWWREVEDHHLQLLCLPQLKSLNIRGCQQLISFPLCPRVEDLSLCDSNKRLQIMRIGVSDLTKLSLSHCFS